MRTALLLLWGIVGWLAVVVGGTWPDHYAEMATGGGEALPYPIAGVLEYVGIVGLMAAMLLGLLRPWSYARSWGRALIALFLFVPQWLVFAMAQMHSPPYMFAHFVWLTATVVGLGGLTLASMGAALFLPAPVRRAHS